jgi:NADH-quinone oxidoreductase subunit N
VLVLLTMFFTDPPAGPPRVTNPSVLTSAAVTMGVAVGVLPGIAPQPLLDLANQAGQFIR